MTASSRSIAVVGGAGYVGLVYCAGLAALGHRVIGVDADHERVRQLMRGSCPIHESGLASLLARGQAEGRLRFTTEYGTAIPDVEFVFICVGTPASSTGEADLRAVLAATEAISQHARGHTTIVTKSTLPVGTMHSISTVLAQRSVDGASFAVVANPEFLREGTAVADFFHPDRIVLGADDAEAADDVASLYAGISAPILKTDPCSAEMIKYASNAYLATKISFINEVAAICEHVGASVDVVARGMGLDHRIGSHFLAPGVGFGGSCFPKDVRALMAMAREAGVNTTMLAATLAINASVRQRVIDKLTQALGTLAGKRIAIFGLAFKPGTDDLREAPAIAVIQALVEAGAVVRATDPVAMGSATPLLPQVELIADPYAAATGADAIVVVTEWDCYRHLNLDRLANVMRGRTIIDGRNCLDSAKVLACGLDYLGVGRPTAPAASAVTVIAAEPFVAVAD